MGVVAGKQSNECTVIIHGEETVVVEGYIRTMTTTLPQIDAATYGESFKPIPSGPKQIELYIESHGEPKKWHETELNGLKADMARTELQILRGFVDRMRLALGVDEGVDTVAVARDLKRKVKKLKKQLQGYESMKDKFAELLERVGEMERLKQIVTEGKSVSKRIIEI